MAKEAPTRFLLYIDILGFSEMVKNDPRKVARTYAIINDLNATSDASFKVIVFSDTILIYNPEEAVTDDLRKFYVWYLTEFAEDLYSRLVGQDIWFRSVLIAGQFEHYQLSNIDCFYGVALITAYLAEKVLPVTGLLMHSSCLEYNQYFRIEPFGKDYHFVYLSRALEHLHEMTADEYPYPEGVHMVLADFSPQLPEGVRYLSDIYRLMRTHPDPQVRTKALTTWDFYARRYPGMVTALTANNFELTALAPEGVWRREAEVLEKSIRHFKRAGAGTDMSVSINRARNRGKSRPPF